MFLKLFNLVLILIPLCSCTAPQRGNPDAYIVEGRFVREQIAEDEFIIEADAANAIPMHRDRYLKEAAARLTLEKGYTFFTCDLKRAQGDLIGFGPAIIDFAKVKLFHDNPPIEGVDAKRFLEINTLF